MAKPMTIVHEPKPFQQNTKDAVRCGTCNQPLDKYGRCRGCPVCGAPKRGPEGGFCRRKAGTGTIHLGQGRCKLHGGRSQQPGSASYKHGLSSKVPHPVLRSKIEELSQNRDIFDLREHIFTLEAIGMALIESGDFMPASKVLVEVTKAIERLHLIEVGRNYVITVVDVGAILERVIDIIDRTVPDEFTRSLIAEGLSNIKLASLPQSNQKQLPEAVDVEYEEEPPLERIYH